jgi:hypothetical protein
VESSKSTAKLLSWPSSCTATSRTQQPQPVTFHLHLCYFCYVQVLRDRSQPRSC